MHGARVVALQGNFDDALRIVRELAEKHPIELVNSVNPHRIEGQKTAAFEVVEELGEAPGALAIPVGNAGNVTAYWRGFQEAGTAPVLYGFQAEGAAPLVHGEPVANPETSPRRSGSATRPAGRRRWPPSPPRAAASPPSPTSRSSTPTAGWRPAKGVFCEPASAASVAGLLAHGLPDRRGRRAARVGRLRPHRPRPQGPRHRPLQGPAGDQLRERLGRGRAGGVRVAGYVLQNCLVRYCIPWI